MCPGHDLSKTAHTTMLLRKHIQHIEFIPKDHLDPSNLPQKKDFSSKDLKRFPDGPDDDKIIGYYRVFIDQHLWNRDHQAPQPKYHGGKSVYYYPVSQREYKRFGDFPTITDFEWFYRF